MLPPRVSVIGAPASDAWIFARLLADRTRRRIVCTRTLLRLEAAHQTHVGLQVERALYQNPGVLPSALVAPLVTQALHGVPEVVIGGYPRTLEQYRHMASAGVAPQLVVHVSLPAERQAHRFRTRHVCGGCGLPLYAPESTTFSTLCDCPTPVPNREHSDAPEAAARRAAAHAEHTVPMLAELRSRGMLKEVEAEEETEPTWRAIESALALEPAG